MFFKRDFSVTVQMVKTLSFGAMPICNMMSMQGVLENRADNFRANSPWSNIKKVRQMHVKGHFKGYTKMWFLFFISPTFWTMRFCMSVNIYRNIHSSVSATLNFYQGRTQQEGFLFFFVSAFFVFNFFVILLQDYDQKYSTLVEKL